MKNLVENLVENLEQLNIDIGSYLFHRPYIFPAPFYVSNIPEHRSNSMLLLSELGSTGYHLVLQKDTKEWLFSLWRQDTDLVCATHGNTIEEALYDAMVIAVHQMKETKNV